MMDVVIMAGGSGTRFWPLSREKRPKQFLDIIGNKPMLMQTFDRIQPLVPENRVFIVVGKEHETETRNLFSGHEVRIVVEPVGRNTAPCIGLAAMLISLEGRDDPVVILPADHYIAKTDTFTSDIRKAVSVAVDRECIVTVGILPTRPETGYGYIEQEEGRTGIYGARRVKKFVEKPDFDTARQYLESGRFFWNAGIFVARPSVLLKQFEAYMPSFYQGLMDLRHHVGRETFYKFLKNIYEKVENISFDYAIMEKTTTPVFVIPSNCGWSDVGSWYSLYELRVEKEASDYGNIMDGDGGFFHSKRCFVLSRSGRWIAVLGVEGILVVDTPDAVLVADMRQHQNVREITEYLKSVGKDHLR